MNGVWDICGMTYLKTELLRDLPRSDCFHRASAHTIPYKFFRLQRLILPGLLILNDSNKRATKNMAHMRVPTMAHSLRVSRCVWRGHTSPKHLTSLQPCSWLQHLRLGCGVVAEVSEFRISGISTARYYTIQEIKRTSQIDT